MATEIGPTEHLGTRQVESNCLLDSFLAGFKFPMSPPVAKVGQAHRGGWSGNKGVKSGTLQPCGGQHSRAKRAMDIRRGHSDYLGIVSHIICTCTYCTSSLFFGAKASFPTYKMKVWIGGGGGGFGGGGILCKAVPPESSRWRTVSRFLSCGEGLS